MSLHTVQFAYIKSGLGYTMNRSSETLPAFDLVISRIFGSRHHKTLPLVYQALQKDTFGILNVSVPYCTILNDTIMNHTFKSYISSPTAKKHI